MADVASPDGDHMMHFARTALDTSSRLASATGSDMINAGEELDYQDLRTLFETESRC